MLLLCMDGPPVNSRGEILSLEIEWRFGIFKGLAVAVLYNKDRVT